MSACPWCGTDGASADQIAACRLWSKADNDLVCVGCEHEHSERTCPTCGCTQFGDPISPCEAGQ